jgi:hypothetical protein
MESTVRLLSLDLRCILKLSFLWVPVWTKTALETSDNPYNDPYIRNESETMTGVIGD